MNPDQIQVPVDTIIKRLQDQISQLSLRVITLESYIEILQTQAPEQPVESPERLTAQDIQERAIHTQASGEAQHHA